MEDTDTVVMVFQVVEVMVSRAVEVMGSGAMAVMPSLWIASSALRVRVLVVASITREANLGMPVSIVGLMRSVSVSTVPASTHSGMQRMQLSWRKIDTNHSRPECLSIQNDCTY